MLSGIATNTKYVSLWFDCTAAQTNIQPHSRWACSH